jgi:hypothetical protein
LADLTGLRSSPKNTLETLKKYLSAADLYLKAGIAMTQNRTGKVTLVLGKRQMLYGAGMIVFLLWSFAAVTHLVGDVAFPTSVAAGELPDAEPVLIIDSVTEQEYLAENSLAPTPVEETPQRQVAHVFSPAEPGRLFVQVASVNRSLAQVYAEYLTRRDMPAFVVSGRPGDRPWVLVGPIADESHLAQVRAELAEAGFEAH